MTDKKSAEAAVKAAEKAHAAAARKADAARVAWLQHQRTERMAYHALRAAQAHPALVDIDAEILAMVGVPVDPAPVYPPAQRVNLVAAPPAQSAAPEPDPGEAYFDGAVPAGAQEGPWAGAAVPTQRSEPEVAAASPEPAVEDDDEDDAPDPWNVPGAEPEVAAPVEKPKRKRRTKAEIAADAAAQEAGAVAPPAAPQYAADGTIIDDGQQTFTPPF